MQVMSRHERALCHLRERKRSDRIALFLGAGVSKNFGFPDWKELIDRIEQQPEFSDYVAPASGQSLAFRTQVLIQHLQRSSAGTTNPIDAAAERVAKHKWISIVQRCLYSGTKSDSELQEHPYLGTFLSVIKESPLTINYNFDDCIERMLASTFATEQSSRNERVYETVWDPSTQYQRSKGVIYHPNGFLPKKLIDGYSDQIVFAEGEFADQLIQSMHGHYSTLISHLSRYTSLLLGLSLDDPTLKHLLRQNTYLNPGHVHYWLKHCETLPTPDAMREEQEVNFEVYGIITLHLTSCEFASFGRLLACGDDEYAEAADRLGIDVKQIYYITGAVGAGKSSAVQKMKSLCWLGEWVDPKPDVLAKAHVDLSPEERAEVDRWVSQQFRKKDFKIGATIDGLIICDRSPIDPLAFTGDEARSARAREHIDTMAPQASPRRLAKGHVIFLSATGGELLARAKHRHLEATEEYLDCQQQTLRDLYKMPNSAVTEISTCGRSLAQVVRNVAKTIHLGAYTEFDLHLRLKELTRGREREV
jgi:hypothetical protein